MRYYATPTHRPSYSHNVYRCTLFPLLQSVRTIPCAAKKPYHLDSYQLILHSHPFFRSHLCYSHFRTSALLPILYIRHVVQGKYGCPRPGKPRKFVSRSTIRGSQTLSTKRSVHSCAKYDQCFSTILAQACQITMDTLTMEAIKPADLKCCVKVEFVEFNIALGFISDAHTYEALTDAEVQ